ncbi:MAG: hypothetical protein LBN07_00715 [Christensenellaceae bacterium]|jgi:hypothetical protein|nr:hypothetical protein [Christensenellaceae bacterium]
MMDGNVKADSGASEEAQITQSQPLSLPQSSEGEALMAELKDLQKQVQEKRMLDEVKKQILEMKNQLK